MRDLRSNRDNVPDLDRFGFRPLTNPTNVPQLEQRSHRNVQSSNSTNVPQLEQRSHRNVQSTRPTSSSSASSGAAAAAATATPKRSTVGQDNNEFLREALQIHNELRRRHGVEPLRLNNDLSKLAQEWGK
jgi:uncharacterized protein YkwD